MRDKLKLLLFESSVYVSIQSALYIIIASILFSVSIDWMLFLIVFLSSFFVYTINKYTDLEEDKINNPIRYNFFMNNKKIMIFLTMVAFVSSILLSFLYGNFIVFLTLLPFILGILYSVRFVPTFISKNKRRLKDISLGKNFVVSMGWATRILYVVPLVGFSSELISIFIYIFLIEFIANIAFDIRDIEGDRITGIRTLPVILGASKSLKIMMLINLIALLFAFSIFIFGIMNIKIVILSLGMFIFYYIITRMILKHMDKTIIYDFLTDSLTVVLLLLVLITQSIGL